MKILAKLNQVQNKFFNFIVSEDKKKADLYIYGMITSWRWDDKDVSSYSFKDELEAIGNVDELNIHINSRGGDVFEGVAIYNLIKQYNAVKNVFIDGIAGSIASVIAMAGDNVYMSKTSIMMIHNCYCWEQGNAEQLRKRAEELDKIMEALKSAYLQRITISDKKLQELLDDESYMTADECKEYGFIDDYMQYENEQDDKLSAASNGYYNLVLKLKDKDKKIADLEKNNKVLDSASIEQISECVVNKIVTAGIYQKGYRDSLSLEGDTKNKKTGSFVESFLMNCLREEN